MSVFIGPSGGDGGGMHIVSLSVPKTPPLTRDFSYRNLLEHTELDYWWSALLEFLCSSFEDGPPRLMRSKDVHTRQMCRALANVLVAVAVESNNFESELNTFVQENINLRQRIATSTYQPTAFNTSANGPFTAGVREYLPENFVWCQLFPNEEYPLAIPENVYVDLIDAFGKLYSFDGKGGCFFEQDFESKLHALYDGIRNGYYLLQDNPSQGRDRKPGFQVPADVLVRDVATLFKSSMKPCYVYDSDAMCAVKIAACFGGLSMGRFMKPNMYRKEFVPSFYFNVKLNENLKRYFLEHPTADRNNVGTLRDDALVQHSKMVSIVEGCIKATHYQIESETMARVIQQSNAKKEAEEKASAAAAELLAEIDLGKRAEEKKAKKKKKKSAEQATSATEESDESTDEETCNQLLRPNSLATLLTQIRNYQSNYNSAEGQYTRDKHNRLSKETLDVSKNKMNKAKERILELKGKMKAYYECVHKIECVICLEKLTQAGVDHKSASSQVDPTEVVALPCKPFSHLLHYGCVQEFAARSPQELLGPKCRAPFLMSQLTFV